MQSYTSKQQFKLVFEALNQKFGRSAMYQKTFLCVRNSQIWFQECSLTRANNSLNQSDLILIYETNQKSSDKNFILR